MKRASAEEGSDDRLRASAIAALCVLALAATDIVLVGAVEEDRVWMACTCGAVMNRSADDN